MEEIESLRRQVHLLHELVAIKDEILKDSDAERLRLEAKIESLHEQAEAGAQRRAELFELIAYWRDRSDDADRRQQRAVDVAVSQATEALEGQLHALRRRNGTGQRRGRPVGYSDAQAAEVRRLREQGETAADIATKVNLSESTVRRILTLPAATVTAASQGGDIAMKARALASDRARVRGMRKRTEKLLKEAKRDKAA